MIELWERVSTNWDWSVFWPEVLGKAVRVTTEITGTVAARYADQRTVCRKLGSSNGRHRSEGINLKRWRVGNRLVGTISKSAHKNEKSQPARGDG